jgi:NAD dependent epimerase/dehydratase family enzyme
MQLIVTGATGTLGSLLVRHLLAEGHAVRVLTRRPFRAADTLPENVGIVEWHPTVAPPPMAAFRDVEAVVHLMGEPVANVEGGRIDRYAGARVAATEHIIAGMSGGPWRLVVASVAPASRDGDAVLTEASPREAATMAASGEVIRAEAAAQAARAAGASVAIVRLGLLLTPGGVLAALVRDAAAGLVPSLRLSRIPAIDPADAAAMLAGLAGRPEVEGPLNGVAPEPLQGGDLERMIAKAARLPFTLRVSPRAAAARYGAAAPLLLNRARVVPQRLVEMGALYTMPDPKPAAERIVTELIAERRARTASWQELLPPGRVPVLRKA